MIGLFSTYSAQAATTIDADRMEATQGTNSAKFSGKVSLIMDALHLQSDTLIVHYADRLGGKIKHAEAMGNVHLQREKVRGKSDTATLDRKRDIIILSGHAELDEPGRQVRGARIIHHLTSGNTKVLRSNDHHRVHIHIDDDQQEKKAQ
ncbi:MAG: LptA/OstA family protein [Mariprofundales bacterium]|nr:LptA/OstA family protein [Mariprofundales bacterium]